MSKFLRLFIAAFALLALPNTVLSEGYVSIVHVDGLTSHGRLATDQTITFHLRFSNYTGGEITSFAHGFKIFSPDGAGWTSSEITDVAGYHEFLTVYNPYRYGNGMGADTLGITNNALPGGQGIPGGFNKVISTIVIGPISSSNIGLTICLDSSYFPPAGSWVWNSDAVGMLIPAWSGPHCYEVADCESDSDGDGYGDACDNCPTTYNPGQEDFNRDGLGDSCQIDSLWLQVAEGAKGSDSIVVGNVQFDIWMDVTSAGLVGQLNGFEISSPDGATWSYQAHEWYPNAAIWWTAIASVGTFSANGSLADTIAFGGAKLASMPLPAGFHEPAFKIAITLDSDDIGKTLCIDSSWFPPGGEWIWHTQDGPVEPEWSGPHCYTIVATCCEGTRGDVNGDGADLDIVDLTCIVDHLFGDDCEIPCLDEADVNGDGGIADIVDLTWIAAYLFGVPPELVPCE